MKDKYDSRPDYCRRIIKSRRELATSSLVADRYACGQQIYRSRNSIVYQGWDTVSGNAVVLKKLPDGASPQRVAEFCREGTILKLQTHPGLIHGEGYFFSHEQHWLVMEPARGELLLDLLASGETCKWPIKFKIKILKNIACAIKALHKLRWEHGDIKPDNLFINTKDANVTILDYSSSAVIGSPRATQSYSPEWRPSWLLNGRIDTRADAYGLALLAISLWFPHKRVSEMKTISWIAYRFVKIVSKM
ncbi:protein kinase [Sansalvadorimonas sp. 2012CJ34-2]|uniref:Protein kinase n=1 Tax=Parendozoicomonas callyspongiae TaxID=2942213 RepID=A0ABT0PL64_9GAMM|nr:protein kinase [Sansalvadorimonas sp. 2012CJ34-2]MCL6272124.1 protein kinase [Sansalvadorimonas sp. 2012CJ34-2]